MDEKAELIFDAKVEQRVTLIAGATGDVLITGPTGAGKSEVARWIHQLSERRNMPFVALNCGAIAQDLADDALFGHVRGAFTTASTDAVGIVAKADRGTLFLDEIGELPLAVQVKLLTLLQEHTYRRVGSAREEHADFRLIAATNRDLLALCGEGRFREDLYHRINVLTIELPALRDSPDRARQIAAGELGRQPVSGEHAAEVLAAVDRLSRHPAAWPGNARELLSFVRRCFLGVEEEERRICDEWARRRPGVEGRLTAIAPAVGPSLVDLDRYAGLIHHITASGARRTAVLPEVSRELASRLLLAYPSALSLDDVMAALGVRDRRTLRDNVELLVNRGLVRRSGEGIVANWPPATSALLGRRQGEWILAGPGEILSLDHGDRIRVELRSKCASTLGVLLVTHTAKGVSVPNVIMEWREIPAGKMVPIEIQLDDEGGLEQVLLHVGPPLTRGGSLVEPMVAEQIMPDAEALEGGRRMALARWKEGWLAEHLVFHRHGRAR